MQLLSQSSYCDLLLSTSFQELINNNIGVQVCWTQQELRIEKDLLGEEGDKGIKGETESKSEKRRGRRQRGVKKSEGKKGGAETNRVDLGQDHWGGEGSYHQGPNFFSWNLQRTPLISCPLTSMCTIQRGKPPLPCNK